MEIQHLRHLVAASETFSFAKAARKCFTTRQNIAHSIKVIETRLGVTLFERKGNEMLLTPQGVEAVRAAREIVEKVEYFNVLFAKPEGTEDVLSLAVSNNLFAGVPTTTDAVLRSFSDKLYIRECDCEKCYELVRSERFDLALVMCMKREFPDCNVRDIASSETYAVVNPESPLAKKQSLTIMDFKDQELLLMSKPPFQYEQLIAQMKDLGFDNTVFSVMTSTSSMLHMVRKYNMVGLVSRKFATDPPSGVVAVPLDDPRFNWHFYMLFQMDIKKFGTISRIIKGVQETFKDDKGCSI